MFNGWNHDDFKYHLRCVGFHGCRTVDLILTPKRAFTKEKVIHYLSVQDLSYLSEHKAILFSLTVNNGGELKVREKILCCSITVHESSKRFI